MSFDVIKKIYNEPNVIRKFNWISIYFNDKIIM